MKVHRDAGHAVIEIADTGVGIPPEAVPLVFERFFRSDPSRSRGHGGAGLGLSIVDAIVEAHRGTVMASSAPGEGMTITVRLPLAPAAEPEPETDEESDLTVATS